MGNLLADCVITNSYSSKNANNPKAWTNGELYFSGAFVSAGSTYIKIKNTGYTYYFDCEVTVSSNNRFYIGFEKYDANKTSTANQSCVYTVSLGNTAVTRQHYSSIVNLATDSNGNATDTICLRILSGWSGSSDAANSSATVHSVTLREVPTSSLATMNFSKNGQIDVDFFNEQDNAHLYNDSYIAANNFIEI